MKAGTGEKDRMWRSSEDWTRWLLQLARTPLDETTDGQLVDLSADVLSFTTSAGTVRRSAVGGPREWQMTRARRGGPSTTTLRPAVLRQLQEDARGMLDALSTGKPWEPPTAPPRWRLETKAPVTLRRGTSEYGERTKARRTGRAWDARQPSAFLVAYILPVARVYTIESTRSVFLARAADLVLEHWPRIRRCGLAGCRAFFLPRHGKELFCDPRHGQRARWARYNEAHPDRTGRRDYRREYEARLRRRGMAPVLRRVPERRGSRSRSRA